VASDDRLEHLLVGDLCSFLDWDLVLAGIEAVVHLAARVHVVADLIVHCISHPSASGTFVASDGEDLSTPDLIRRLGMAISRQPYLVPVPASVLCLAGKLLGKANLIERLCESLAIDSGHVRRAIQWSPPYSVDQGIERTGSSYRTQQVRVSAE
jgi:nucleoside-diphosphate-sugar epimerase